MSQLLGLWVPFFNNTLPSCVVWYCFIFPVDTCSGLLCILFLTNVLGNCVGFLRSWAVSHPRWRVQYKGTCPRCRPVGKHGITRKGFLFENVGFSLRFSGVHSGEDISDDVGAWGGMSDLTSETYMRKIFLWVWECWIGALSERQPCMLAKGSEPDPDSLGFSHVTALWSILFIYF